MSAPWHGFSSLISFKLFTISLQLPFQIPNPNFTIQNRNNVDRHTKIREVAGKPWSFAFTDWLRTESREANWWLTRFRSLGGPGYSTLLNPEGPYQYVSDGQNSVEVFGICAWEVVTMDERHLVATPERNSDLYWVLTGSGPGNFDVVLSMTARLRPDGVIGGAVLTFDDSSAGSDRLWDAIGASHLLLPAFTGAGNSFLYTLTNRAFYTFAAPMPG
ncbi:hypothetical protein BDV06DRAFT_226676 [Aspergillus oleicola]